MNDWQEIRFNDLVSKLGDGLHGTPKYSDNGDYLFINGSNLSNGRIITDQKTKRVSKEEFNKYRKDLSDRTIFLSINGTIGNVGTYNGEKIILGKSACYFNVKDSVSKDFIKYIVNGPDFQKYIVDYATGTTIKNVPLKAIREFLVKIPPLPTQKAIAEILSSLDDKIELNNQINQNLEVLAQALFKQWFVDFEFPNEKGEPYKSSGGEMVDSELGEIPKGWRIKNLEEFGEVICGKTPSKADPENFGNEVPFIKIPDMHGKIFITEVTESLSVKGANSQKKKYLPSGSIMVSSIATVGLVGLTTRDSQTNQQINSIIPNSSILTYFLYFLCLELKPTFLNHASGGAVTLNMNTSTFKSIKVIHPDGKVLKDFHEGVKPIFEQILNLQIENEQLICLRETLLPKLISGELEVSQLENEVYG
jgi:type I restriction enzyme, S subunit